MGASAEPSGSTNFLGPIGVTPLGGASCYSLGTTIGMALSGREPRAPNWNEYLAKLYRNEYFSRRRGPADPLGPTHLPFLVGMGSLEGGPADRIGMANLLAFISITPSVGDSADLIGKANLLISTEMTHFAGGSAGPIGTTDLPHFIGRPPLGGASSGPTGATNFLIPKGWPHLEETLRTQQA